MEQLEDGMDDLKTQVENSRNEWLATKGEMKSLEQQLVKERGKIRRLANDKHDLQEKVNLLLQFVYFNREYLRVEWGSGRGFSHHLVRVGYVGVA